MSASRDPAAASPGSRASVWDTLAAMKARHSALQTQAESQRASMRMRKEAIAALDREFAAAAAAGKTDGADVLSKALGEGRDPAVSAMLDEQRKALGSGPDAERKEIQEIINLQQKACLELERAKLILSNIADEREIADSRAGRLEYKVRS
jgi:hypothetical protein